MAKGPRTGEIEVPGGQVRLPARLGIPDRARAVVVFAHGTSGGRLTPHDRHVAGVLQWSGLGTLSLDLLAEDEGGDPHLVFDIVLLARRLCAATTWLRRETALPVAYFGSGTGAAAALEAAADDRGVRAIVSQGGRPDLSSPRALAQVRAPTLFVVGSLDTRVLGLNRLAADWMCCVHRIVAVPGAGPSFEETGVLDTAAELARDWFTDHLTRPPAGLAHG